MESVKVINDVTVRELRAAIFGDEQKTPFQIKLLRTRVGESVDQWTWKVQLPLKNASVQGLFESLILSSLQITNDELPATFVITAYPTNVGYEPRFQFSNCTFLKRGMRRLRKAFLQTMERWNAARESVAVAWEEGGLQTQAEIRAIELCQCESPQLVQRLLVRMYGTSAGKDVLTVIATEDAAELIFLDFDSRLAESGFRSAVRKELEIYLRGLVKKGMAEYLDLVQEKLVGESPALLLEALKELGVQRDRLEFAGIPMTAGTHLPELMAHLEEYLQYKKDSEKPGVPITFSVYKSGQLFGKYTRSDNVIKIGRIHGENVVLLDIEDHSLPRIHSVIEQCCGRVCLIDLATMLPTTVNGEPVTGKHNLHNGDQIGVGKLFTIKVEFQETPSDEVSAQHDFVAPDPDAASTNPDAPSD
jgi:hypothetical protein